MNRKFTCIICPNGCAIEVEYEGEIISSVNGNLCSKGVEYVTQELIDPKRTIASSARVENGDMPIVSVRVTKAIPKKCIFNVMREINELVVQAPIKMGDVLISNVLGLESDLIATNNVSRK